MADASCKVGARYLNNIFTDGMKKGRACAKKLNAESKDGSTYIAVKKYENISDGLPPVVMMSYVEVISGKKVTKK